VCLNLGAVCVFLGLRRRRRRALLAFLQSFQAQTVPIHLIGILFYITSSINILAVSFVDCYS